MIERFDNEPKRSPLEKAALRDDPLELESQLKAMGVGGFGLSRARTRLFGLSEKQKTSVYRALTLASSHGSARCVEMLALSGAARFEDLKRVLIDCIQRDDAPMARALLSAKPTLGVSLALVESARVGATLCAAFLLGSDPGLADVERALVVAAKYGRLEMVKTLAPLCDPKQGQSEALRAAALTGNFECVIALIPVSDPQAMDSEALRVSARQGNPQVVRLLIPLSDPTRRRSQALEMAFESGVLEIVSALLPESPAEDIREIIARAQDPSGRSSGWSAPSASIEMARAYLNALDEREEIGVIALGALRASEREGKRPRARL